MPSQVAERAVLRQAARVVRRQRDAAERTATLQAARILSRYFAALAVRLKRGARLGGTKAVAPWTADDLVDWNYEERVLRRALRGFYSSIAEAAFDDAARLGLDVRFDLSARPVARILYRVGRQVTNITADSRNRLASMIATGIEQGLAPADIAQNLVDATRGWAGIQDLTHSRAMVIARTETANAYTWSSNAAYRESGLVANVLCLDSPDCGWDGHDDPELADGTERTLDEMETHPLSHPNAVFAGTRVAPLGEVLTGYGAQWRGPATEITTATGAVLAVGPHHPVFTRRGWLTAESVRQGDHVYRGFGPDWTAPDLDDVPEVEQVFESMRPVGTSTRVQAVPAHLHGDGPLVEGDIHVVRPHRPLTAVGHSEYVHLAAEGILEIARSELEAFTGASAGHLREQTVDAASARSMRSLDVGRVGILGADGDAALAQSGAERAVAVAVLLAERERAAAIQVIADAVVEVRNIDARGWHAYDLETSTRMYLANGIVVHNCVRAYAPIVQ